MIRFKRTVLQALAGSLLLGTVLGDVCSTINIAYSDCQLSTMCSTCVTTSGCEYNLMDGTCSTASASNTTSATAYCSSTDSVCASCTVSSSKPTCTGEDGSCICPSLCDIVSSTSEECSSGSGDTATLITRDNDNQNFSMMYLGVAFGAMCIMLSLYMQRKRNERRVEHHMSLVRQEMEARREQRHREREMLRARRPELALNLETWRDHVELHKPQMSKVELETCYYLMMQDEKKNKGKKSSDRWDSSSDGEVKLGIGAITSPIASGVSNPTSLQSPLSTTTAPYFAMREEYPSNTKTDGSVSGSEIGSVADEDEEKPDVAIDVEHSTTRR